MFEAVNKAKVFAGSTSLLNIKVLNKGLISTNNIGDIRYGIFRL